MSPDGELGRETAIVDRRRAWATRARVASPGRAGSGRGPRLVRARNHRRPAGAGRRASPRPKPPPPTTGAPPAPTTPAAPTAPRSRPLPTGAACSGRRRLPATPETVAAFLAAEAGRGLAVNTLRLRHAALRYLHLLAGYPPPTASPLVSATFAGIRRAHRRPLRKKTALVLEPLRATLQAIPDTLPGFRDRALILVGFAAALRPSELARLDIASLTRHEDGIALFLPWRKNDQEAHGTTVWLPVGQTDLCPVRALEAWLAAAEITEGPLFRRLWRLPPPRVRKGVKTKADSRPLPDWYQSDRHRFDRADRQEMDRPGRARRCRLCRAQPAPRCDLERCRARRPHCSAQAVFRPRVAEKPRRICRARRIAPQSSAEGRALTKLEVIGIRLALGKDVGELSAARDVIRRQQ